MSFKGWRLSERTSDVTVLQTTTMLLLNMFYLYLEVFILSSSQLYFSDAPQLIGAHGLHTPRS